MKSYSSKLLENAVHELCRLPGIGQKTALRLALHLIREDRSVAEALGNSIIRLRNEIVYCKRCHNISDSDLCDICADPSRHSDILCVVEDMRDIIAIENTGQYHGLFHVLGGIISPMDGIGPGDLNVESLVERVQSEGIREVIMALQATIEGDTTNFYIYKKIRDICPHISTIARGVSVGDSLEYADEVTLGRSIVNRLPYEQTLRK
ncbi:MAG: recombination protein RecR [Bacteroidales bacterium]|nr:recombination protein RecR [Bacteroidales bacterium]